MSDIVAEIGRAAGAVYKALELSGTWMSMTKLKTETGLTADMVQRGLGWLAREDKIQFQLRQLEYSLYPFQTLLLTASTKIDNLKNDLIFQHCQQSQYLKFPF